MANQGGSHEQHVKAGEQSHKNTQNQQKASSGGNDKKGGSGGNFADDRDRASEAGKKGGSK
ncbi:MAG TPA: KGG domain-containing protein [Mesorhizobium sp.]|jgi:general stress protein YciG|uniref:KGG domain-containing protein n=1 Tax=Mesorhizobium sp. TaxID=1871066 RepID=UPI002DDCCF4C|nr:KGG domain-containing protein [Mesorhizobium sp.]HEV2503639.1 KGG domain-containing protein [Mesorhizobium sp.]